MKNKKLALLLAILSLQPANGLTEYEKIKLDEYFENQKKEIDEKTKNLELASNRVNNVSMIYGATMVGSSTILGLILAIFCKQYGDYMIPDKAIKKIMARFEKLRYLDNYNERYKGFLEEISKISIECNENDYGSETDLKRKFEKAKDEESKSNFEAQKTPFKLIANKSHPVCDDYTVVFGTIAQSLGIYCAKLVLLPNDKYLDESPHAALLLAKMKDPVTDPNHPWEWKIFDGRWFSSEEHKNIKDADGTISLEHLDDAWGDEYKGGGRHIYRDMLSSWTSLPKGDFLKLDNEDIKNLKDGGYLLIPKFYREAI